MEIHREEPKRRLGQEHLGSDSWRGADDGGAGGARVGGTFQDVTGS